MQWGQFAGGFARSGFFDSLQKMMQMKMKNDAAKKKADAEAEAEAAKTSATQQAKYHKTAKSTLDKNHPEWHMNNFKQMNIEREQAGDPNMPPLSIDDYKAQFLGNAYPPEKYSDWGSNVVSNPKGDAQHFMPSEKQVEEGQAYVEFERTTKAKVKAGKAGEELGKDLETDLKPKLTRLEKQKEAHEKYELIQSMTEEEVQAEIGVSKADIETMRVAGKLGQFLTGDANVVPIWTGDDQKKYVDLVRRFNRSQDLQGTGYTWADVQGRTKAEQLEELGAGKPEITKIPSKTFYDEEGEVEMVTKPHTTTVYPEDSPYIQRIKETGPITIGKEIVTEIDSLNRITRRLKNKYPDLDLQFQQITTDVGEYGD